ncbi:hypothetical protein Droror1_Dr00024570 [Drosera rotundifolia]
MKCRRYISIIKEESLEISQPALDVNKSEVHHQITARGRRGNVHRRTYKHGECNRNSTAPPCTGWIEMMVLVFSKAAWRCVWYMIQNDLIHAWGLDVLLGYCAQGDRLQNVGIVDTEYVIHYGLPTLGEPKDKKVSSSPGALDKRIEVRRQLFNEYRIFQRWWESAINSDKCWTDPYPGPTKKTVMTHVQKSEKNSLTRGVGWSPTRSFVFELIGTALGSGLLRGLIEGSTWFGVAAAVVFVWSIVVFGLVEFGVVLG